MTVTSRLWPFYGVLIGLTLFLAWQGWHFSQHPPITLGTILADFLQWQYAGFCIGIAIRARSLSSTSKADGTIA